MSFKQNIGCIILYSNQDSIEYFKPHPRWSRVTTDGLWLSPFHWSLKSLGTEIMFKPNQRLETLKCPNRTKLFLFLLLFQCRKYENIYFSFLTLFAYQEKLCGAQVLISKGNSLKRVFPFFTLYSNKGQKKKKKPWEFAVCSASLRMQCRVDPSWTLSMLKTLGGPCCKYKILRSMVIFD